MNLITIPDHELIGRFNQPGTITTIIIRRVSCCFEVTVLEQDIPHIQHHVSRDVSVFTNRFTRIFKSTGRRRRTLRTVLFNISYCECELNSISRTIAWQWNIIHTVSR